MSLELERLPLRGSRLCNAYLEEFESVAALYRTGPPETLASYRETAKVIRSEGSADRWRALEELASSLSTDGAARLGRVVEGRGLFVATGQQAGLFVSPLYVLYKALTAARLADDLERRLEVPVMPLFSVASEDHDWQEVNHTHLLDLENRLIRLQLKVDELEDEDAPSPSIERIRLNNEVRAAFTELEHNVPDTEFKETTLTPLRAAYRPGRPFAEAFQEALSRLLRKYGFAVVRTAAPYLKRRTRELLWSEWRQREESERRLLKRTEALIQNGFEPQVPVVAGATNLFLEGRLGRDRVLAEGGKARLRRSNEIFDEGELKRIIENAPGRVSPGALLRPVTEAHAFPVVAYVGGPSEIAYLAQSRVLFELHGVPAPVVVPRASFRLIESKVAKVLEKYGIAPDRLTGDAGAAIRRLLEEQAPQSLQDALAELRETVATAIERVELAALDFDPGSRSAVGSGKKAVFDAITELEGKLRARVREKHAVMEGQLEKAAVNLYPDGRPQERVLNPYMYLVRYGESLLDRVYDAAAIPLE